MKLYIDTSDTSDRAKIVIGINEKRFNAIAKEKSSQKILPFIDEVLKKNKLSTSDIKEIEVNTGPGSFTGLRIGVAIANTLGWSLGVPVNGKKVLEQPIDITYS